MPCDVDAEVAEEPSGQIIIVLKPHWAVCPDAKLWRKAKEDHYHSTGRGSLRQGD
jgi:hypothetical protein